MDSKKYRIKRAREWLEKRLNKIILSKTDFYTGQSLSTSYMIFSGNWQLCFDIQLVAYGSWSLERFTESLLDRKISNLRVIQLQELARKIRKEYRKRRSKSGSHSKSKN